MHDDTKCEMEPNLNDCLENIHYFPDEQPFDEPFIENKDQDSSRRPYQLVESKSKTEMVKPSNEHPKLSRPLNKNVHFADQPQIHE